LIDQVAFYKVTSTRSRLSCW